MSTSREKAFYTELATLIKHPIRCPVCTIPVPPEDFEQHFMSHATTTGTLREMTRTKGIQYLNAFLCYHALPWAYHPVHPAPLLPNPLQYDDEALNAGVSCVRTFLRHWKRSYWAHVTVEAADFEKFLAAADADEGRTRTLPFFRWCEGCEDPATRHRHMIVASLSRKHFERNVWKGQPSRPRPIRSALQLINCLGCVGRPTTPCSVSRDYRSYYLFQTLPEGYKLVLAMQYRRGLGKLFDQEYYDMTVRDFVRAPKRLGPDGRWRLSLKDVVGEWYSPVREEFHPCDYPTKYFIYFLDGEKIYYDLDETSGSSAD